VPIPGLRQYREITVFSRPALRGFGDHHGDGGRRPGL